MRDEFWSIARQYSGEMERMPWDVGPGTPQLSIPSGWGQFFKGNGDERNGTAVPQPQPITSSATAR